MFERDFNWAISGSETLQKHKDLLKTLSEDRVMCVCNKEDGSGYYIMECCDEWFCHDLTKEECLELSELFKELADDID